MAQFVVRNIEAEVKSRLQRRAKRNRRSMEEEVRDILRRAAKEEYAPVRGLGTEIVSLFRRAALDADLPELRGYEINPPSFD